MTRLDEYQHKYDLIRFERTDGLLTMTFHTEGGPLRWGGKAHRQFTRAFKDVADDHKNVCIIMTGTGAEFSGPAGSFGGDDQLGQMGSREHDALRRDAKDLLLHLLRIESPIIAAVNGPVLRHAEIPLLSDIVLASEDAYFQDTAHFINRTPPGDGQHILLPMLMGLNRARYYLLTGQQIPAQQALSFGLVSEVLPRDEVLPRAYELAGLLLKQPPLVLRNSRIILTEHLKRRMQAELEHGLVLEALATMP